MKMRLIIALAVVAVFFAAVAKAGPLDFVRDQLGVNATNYPFGSSPSAFPEFQQVNVVNPSPAEALYEYDLPPKPGPTRDLTTGIRLHFTNNKLDRIEIIMGGPERNHKLTAEFAKLSGIDVKTITVGKPYEYSDGQYKLTFGSSAYCFPFEVVIFGLTKVETPK
ncbi:MAG TPA: hypothetical protein VMB22_01790 [Verrucomicrobiae bacterium]|nr:hypothetical protein [Verrucomicrobiae bacterium]